ncbi:MAG: hypothetical protein U9R72_02450 [Chloroflexota bacterium]|nr:hypothetical protein [Chloroflexota bacterium]
MGKYDNLSDKEKNMLRRMGEAYKEADTTSWVLVKVFGGAELLATKGTRLDDVPYEDSFYFGLESKGFLSATWTNQGDLEITLQQPAIEYADYASKPGPARWWENRMHDLAEDRRVWARIFWHLVTFGLGLVSGLLLRAN